MAPVLQGPAGSMPGIGGWFVSAGAGTKKDDAQAAVQRFRPQIDALLAAS